LVKSFFADDFFAYFWFYYVIGAPFEGIYSFIHVNIRAGGVKAFKGFPNMADKRVKFLKEILNAEVIVEGFYIIFSRFLINRDFSEISELIKKKTKLYIPQNLKKRATI
jgi:hypothetical protein